MLGQLQSFTSLFLGGRASNQAINILREGSVQRVFYSRPQESNAQWLEEMG
jgi:hypothetical protein